jgi:hypothetical protein
MFARRVAKVTQAITHAVTRAVAVRAAGNVAPRCRDSAVPDRPGAVQCGRTGHYRREFEIFQRSGMMRWST